VFRWEAVAGVFAAHRNGTMPRGASPCGVCIDRDATQFMHLADRCFPALRAEPRFVDALLIPFHIGGQPAGTVWIVAHSDARKFDRGDERVMRTLSEFASAGWQLWKAREQAEQISQRKDEFLAQLGHELRNPLSAIVAATALLNATGAATDSTGRRALGVVARQVQHVTRLAGDLLDLSRINQGKLDLQKHLVELKAALEDAIETNRALIERRGQQLSLELPAEPIWFEADSVRLRQILTNLLENATKYTPERGQILVKAARDGAQACISIKDTGIGIPAERLEDVFDLFKQVGSDNAGGGLGIGLTLVRSLAEMHGGSVIATSEGIGKGSEFIVRLPLAASL
jgi:signal transduction histidine kinase